MATAWDPGLSPTHVAPSSPADHSTLGFLGDSYLVHSNAQVTPTHNICNLCSDRHVFMWSKLFHMKKITPWRMICSVCDKQHNHDHMVFSGNFKYKTQTTDNLPSCPWGDVRFGSFINVRSICAKCCLSHCHSALEESPKWVNFRLEMGEFSVQIWGKPQGSCKP